jgi:hypothetical protein
MLLPYVTQTRREFSGQFALELEKLEQKYKSPRQEPVPGGRLVLSLSKEWLDYDYDGVIWTTDY